MSNFNDIYKKIIELNDLVPKPDTHRLAKLSEEFGELAKAVNKKIGMKKLSPEDTEEAIRQEIVEEAADTIQNVISLVGSYDITAEELLIALATKNKKWENDLRNRKNT